MRLPVQAWQFLESALTHYRPDQTDILATAGGPPRPAGPGTSRLTLCTTRGNLSTGAPVIDRSGWRRCSESHGRSSRDRVAAAEQRLELPTL